MVYVRLLERGSFDRPGAVSRPTVGQVSLSPAYAQKARGGRLLLGCKLLTAPDPERTAVRIMATGRTDHGIRTTQA